jgi:hypothetical protein
MLKKFKNWMHWRGVSAKDIICATIALSTLMGLIVFSVLIIVNLL